MTIQVTVELSFDEDITPQELAEIEGMQNVFCSTLETVYGRKAWIHALPVLT